MQHLSHYLDADLDLDDLGDALAEEGAQVANKTRQLARALFGALAPRLASAWATTREVWTAARDLVERLSAAEQIHTLARMPVAEAALLSDEEQWERATESLFAACEAAGAADRLQTAATEQIEAANYALQRIMEELEAVMIIPRPAPASAMVHKLENAQGQSPSRVRALAA